MKIRSTQWLLLFVIIAGITLAIIYRDQLDTAAIRQWVQGAGLAGPLVFMLIYVAGTVFFFPGAILTLAGGAIFGPYYGTLYNMIAATVGATLAFLIARYLAADLVKRKTGGHIKQLADGINNEGWRFVAFVRLVPLFPFNLLNYALGLTRIRLSHYVIASWIFMLPGAIAYTWLGYAGSVAVSSDASLAKMIQNGTIALALLATVAFLPRLLGYLRQGPMISVQELRTRLDQDDPVLVLDVRTADEFNGEQGHIENARNIPLEQLGDRLDELSDYLEKTIAIICQTDKCSARASRLLTRHGYADVHIVKGGMSDWNKSGFAVLHAASGLQKERAPASDRLTGSDAGAD